MNWVCHFVWTKWNSHFVPDELSLLPCPDELSLSLRPDEVKLSLYPDEVKLSLCPDKMSLSLYPDELTLSVRSDIITSFGRNASGWHAFCDLVWMKCFVHFFQTTYNLRLRSDKVANCAEVKFVTSSGRNAFRYPDNMQCSTSSRQSEFCHVIWMKGILSLYLSKWSSVTLSGRSPFCHFVWTRWILSLHPNREYSATSSGPINWFHPIYPDIVNSVPPSDEAYSFSLSGRGVFCHTSSGQCGSCHIIRSEPTSAGQWIMQESSLSANVSWSMTQLRFYLLVYLWNMEVSADHWLPGHRWWQSHALSPTLPQHQVYVNLYFPSHPGSGPAFAR